MLLVEGKAYFVVNTSVFSTTLHKQCLVVITTLRFTCREKKT